MTDAPTTRETADHAELAACPFCGGAAKSETLGHGKSARTGVKCADVDCPGSMRLVGADEDGVAFWNRRPREAALLSEIAALRGQYELDSAIIQGFSDRLTQAERQRDELRKALEPSPEMIRVGAWRAKLHREANPGDTWEDTAREVFTIMVAASDALANQGADQ